VSGLLLAQ